MSPSSLRYLFIFIGIVYLVVPFDFVPDPMGAIGRLDDLLLIVYLYFKYRRIRAEASRRGPGQAAPRYPQPEESKSEKTPAEVFDLAPNASRAEITARYRELMTQYHPDKVSHLGEDLKRLAHNKTLEIQGAYESLMARAER